MNTSRECGILRNILDKAGDRTVVLSLGSPYSILNFPTVRSYMCMYSFVTTSERAAVKALFGEIPIHGKLPVTLPGVAKRGDGLEREAGAAAQ